MPSLRFSSYLSIALATAFPALASAADVSTRQTCVTLSSEASEYEFESDVYRRSRFWATRCCSRSDSDEGGTSRSCSAQVQTDDCVDNTCTSNNQSVEASSIKAVSADTYRVDMPDGSTVMFSRNNADPVATCQSSGREGLSDFEFGSCSESGRGFFGHSDYAHNPSITVPPLETIAVIRSRGRRVDYPWMADCSCYLPLYLVDSGVIDEE